MCIRSVELIRIQIKTFINNSLEGHMNNIIINNTVNFLLGEPMQAKYYWKVYSAFIIIMAIMSK